jgi:hypothetical protein
MPRRFGDFIVKIVDRDHVWELVSFLEVATKKNGKWQ